ncbi:MAG: hypothetical protein ACREJ3_06180 [Polyangiaceae bacterium]
MKLLRTSRGAASASLATLILTIAACSSSSSSPGTAPTSSSDAGVDSAASGSSGSSGASTGSSGASTGSSGSAGDASSGSTGDASSGTSTADAGCTTLTVKNYIGWCDVSVNGGAVSPSPTQSVCVAPGSIALSASALQGFDLPAKPWHDTSGDTGSGDPGTVTGTGQTAQNATTVTVGTAAKCVWVCCPTHGTTDCPTSDQCP